VGQGCLAFLLAKSLIPLAQIDHILVFTNESGNSSVISSIRLVLPATEIHRPAAFLRPTDVLPAAANPEREYSSRRGPTGSAPVSF
jgi:hypothetical protein